MTASTTVRLPTATGRPTFISSRRTSPPAAPASRVAAATSVANRADDGILKLIRRFSFLRARGTRTLSGRGWTSAPSTVDNTAGRCARSLPGDERRWVRRDGRVGSVGKHRRRVGPGRFYPVRAVLGSGGRNVSECPVYQGPTMMPPWPTYPKARIRGQKLPPARYSCCKSGVSDCPFSLF